MDETSLETPAPATPTTKSQEKIAHIYQETRSLPHGEELIAHMFESINAVKFGHAQLPQGFSYSQSMFQRVSAAAEVIRELSNSPDDNGVINIDEVRFNFPSYGLELEDSIAIGEWHHIKESYDSRMEAKYGVLKYDEMRKRTAKLIEDGGTGTWIETDILGLKIFNTYGKTEYGDGSIHMMVNFLKDVLTRRFGIEHPELYISRQGDSGFMFVPDKNQAEVMKIIKEEYKAASDSLKMTIRPEHNNGEGKKLPIRLYSDAIEVTQDPNKSVEEVFDKPIDKLSNHIEEIKADNMIKMAAAIEDKFPDNAPLLKLMAVLNFITDKRIVPQLIDIIITSSYDIREKMDFLTQLLEGAGFKGESNREEALDILMELKGETDVQKTVKRMVEMISLDQYDQIPPLSESRTATGL